jgi:D-alanyl-D-alanine carboxypeptidase
MKGYPFKLLKLGLLESQGASRRALSRPRGSAMALAVAAASLVATLAHAQTEPLPGERFQTIIENSVRGGVPGVVLQVETWDGKVWSGAAGVAALDNPAPLTLDQPFRLFGMSKLPVAALALALVDDATLGLDDRIGKWLDPALIQNLPHADEITIRDLIAQTSGIHDYFDEEFVFMTRANPAQKWTPQELVARAVDGEPFSEPDPEISYDSNTNYVLLGLAIERAGKAPLAQQLEERIFKPLAMTDTHSWENMSAPSPVHGNVPQFMVRIDVGDIDLSLAWGAGGLISTAADVAKMTRGIFEGTLLSKSSRALMTEQFRPLANGEAEYGHGTMRLTSFTPSPVGYSSVGVGFGTVTAWWPETGLIVVVLTSLEAEAQLGILEAVIDAINSQ